MNVIVLNLERAEGRRKAFQGAASQRSIPQDAIHFNKGKDHQDYDNDFSPIIKAAAEDGFPYIECYGKGLSGGGIQQTPGTLCQIWNYCRIFRHMVETDQTALVIHDDRMITIDYQDLLGMWDYLKEKGPEFYMWQLRIRNSGNSPEFPAEITLNHEEDVFKTISRPVIGYGDLVRLYLASGVYGGEESMVLSPAGAQWILNSLEDNPGEYMFFDIFINEMLFQFARKKISEGKGIYTSRKKGYAFVDDYMEMGTYTDYAVEGSKEYDKSIASTDYQFLDIDGEHGATKSPIVKSVDNMRASVKSTKPKPTPGDSLKSALENKLSKSS